MAPAESSQTPPAAPPMAPEDAKALCARSIHIMADGDLDDFAAVIHPEAASQEGQGRALGRPRPGAGLVSRRRPVAASRLRRLALGRAPDRRRRRYRRHLLHLVWPDVRPFVTYGEAGAVRQAMPPTTKTFAATQSHWFRLADGKVIEHWANRDDLAMAEQLDRFPPRPATWSGWLSPSAGLAGDPELTPDIRPTLITIRSCRDGICRDHRASGRRSATRREPSREAGHRGRSRHLRRPDADHDAWSSTAATSTHSADLRGLTAGYRSGREQSRCGYSVRHQDRPACRSGFRR